jgi:acetylornithine deacetylase/succinyl-diaminopimelate desuccinylase-like protein
MHPTTDLVWDSAAIRRAIRLLGAHAPRARDPQVTAQALRVVGDMIRRHGFPVEVSNRPGEMPLLVAGSGSTVVVTFLDDPHPAAQDCADAPPQIDGDVVSGPGVTRKAGVLASIGALLTNPRVTDRYTLVVEGDRHAGSLALASWLESTQRRFSAALYETGDLSVPAPAVSRSAAGVLTLEIVVCPSIDTVEAVYAGVVPDTGHLLADALFALKSREGEVLVPSFYDDIATPAPADIARLLVFAPVVAQRITGESKRAGGGFTAAHLTLAMFLAPTLTVRSLEMRDAQPFVPGLARATIEVRVMPGQHVGMVQRSIVELITQRVPAAVVTPVLTRHPATGVMVGAVQLPHEVTELPIAIAGHPGGLLERAGVPALGYATVSRDGGGQDERVTLSSIERGTRIIELLADRLASHAGPGA